MAAKQTSKVQYPTIGTLLIVALAMTFISAPQSACAEDPKPATGSSTGATNQSGKPNLINDIIALEMQVLGKAPESESVEQRLAAMEQHLFGKQYTAGLFVRLSRIKSTLQAQALTHNAVAPQPAAASAAISVPAPAASAIGAGAGSAAPSGSGFAAGVAPGSATATGSAAPSAIEFPTATGSASAAAAGSTPSVDSESSSSPLTSASQAVPVALPGLTPTSSTEATSSTSTAATTKSGKASTTAQPKGQPTKAQQLQNAHQLFEAKDYKGARKLIESFIAKNPLEYNGYYLLGLIDLKEHDALPEYDQFAYDQFLKALYLQPQSPDCKYVCTYVVKTEQTQRQSDPRCVAIPSFFNGSPEALLNVGVNCFLRDDDANAQDLFNFVVKYCPGGAASGYYNLGAMAERRGQLPQALKEYRAAVSACDDRNALYSAGLLRNEDVDSLSKDLALRTIQLVEHKIKTGDHIWTGNEQVKGSRLSARCTINRLSSTDWSADTIDAQDHKNP